MDFWILQKNFIENLVKEKKSFLLEFESENLV